MSTSAQRFFALAGATFFAAIATAQDLPGLAGAGSEPPAPARTISQEQSPADDRAIAKRLREIYKHLDGLDALEVEVSAGVVRLSGEVLSSAAHDKALAIAMQLQGVVEVSDEIVEAQDLDRRLRPVLAALRERAEAIFMALPLFAVALGVVLGAWFLARLLTAWNAPFERFSRNEFARDLIRQAVRAAILIAGAVTALEILDATAVVAAVAGLAGLAGLALSFAFRDLAENYISSVLLSLRQPFLANELVSIDGAEGRVVRLTSRATILIDLDGNHVRIPNAAVYKATILNYTRNPRRRLVFDVGVATDFDLAAAVNLGVATLERMPGLLEEPAPRGWVNVLGDSSVGLRFTAWIDQRETDWFAARGEAMRCVKEAFDAAGIVMPEPAIRVLPAVAGSGRAAAPVGADVQVDIAPENEVANAVAEERAAGGDEDLLDSTRAVE